MDIVMIFSYLKPDHKLKKNKNVLLFIRSMITFILSMFGLVFVLLCPPRPHRVKRELSRDTGKAHSRSHDSGPLKYTCQTRTLPVTLRLQRWGGERRCFAGALKFCVLLHCACMSALWQRCEWVMQQADNKTWRRGTV